MTLSVLDTDINKAVDAGSDKACGAGMEKDPVRTGPLKYAANCETHRMNWDLSCPAKEGGNVVQMGRCGSEGI
jgi:hypothetical protein